MPIPQPKERREEEGKSPAEHLESSAVIGHVQTGALDLGKAERALGARELELKVKVRAAGERVDGREDSVGALGEGVGANQGAGRRPVDRLEVDLAVARGGDGVVGGEPDHERARADGAGRDREAQVGRDVDGGVLGQVDVDGEAQRVGVLHRAGALGEGGGGRRGGETRGQGSEEDGAELHLDGGSVDGNLKEG